MKPDPIGISFGDFYAEARGESERAHLHDLSPEEKACYEGAMAYLMRNPGRTEHDAIRRLKIDERLYFRAKRKAEASDQLAFGPRGFSDLDLIRPEDPIVGGPRGMARKTRRSWRPAGDEVQIPEGLKTCRKCKQPKPYSDYGPNARMRDGFLKDCRICNNEQKRASKRAQKEAG